MTAHIHAIKHNKFWNILEEQKRPQYILMGYNQESLRPEKDYFQID